MSNRLALVTGGASGIGRGIATRLADDGLDVVVADERRAPKQGERFHTDVERPTDELIAERGQRSHYVEVDVSDPDAVGDMIAETIETFGRLDVLVNNAGITGNGSLTECSPAAWDRTLSVNLDGPFYVTREAMSHLTDAEHGRVVNVSSINALFGGGGPDYVTAKAGLLNFTRDVAVEFGPEDVTANAILPGAVESPMQDASTDEELEDYRSEAPRRRLGTPADVAHAVSFFVSPAADWITGTSLAVDGGYVATV